jgi:Flp pilus assembly protein TadG
METFLPPLTNNLRAERGQTMTEFALIAPLLIVFVFGIIQFGIAFNNYVTLTDAARAAARKGAVSRNAGNPQGTCESAGYAAGANLENPGKDFVVACSSSFQPGSDVTVTATYPYSISLLDWVVYSGTLTTTMKERVE